MRPAWGANLSPFLSSHPSHNTPVVGLRPNGGRNNLLPVLTQISYIITLGVRPVSPQCVANAPRKDGRASIASMGFALSSYPVAVERGGMDRRDAAARTLVTLRLRPSFCSPQLQERQAWCKN